MTGRKAKAGPAWMTFLNSKIGNEKHQHGVGADFNVLRQTIPQRLEQADLKFSFWKIF
jgi:hypothetical protein